MNAPTEHPRWCNREKCGRLRVHVSLRLPVDTGRAEEAVLDVALMQTWQAGAEPHVSLTVIEGMDVEQVLMPTRQARVLTHQLRKLLGQVEGDAR